MPQQSRLSLLLTELKRRRVFRVAAVYGGVAFVVVQIVDGTFELMGIPPWVGRLVVVLLGLGFPLAVGLAWVFDITPEGIVRTGRPSSKAGDEVSTPSGSGKPLTSNRALIVIAVLAVAFGVWSRWGGDGTNGLPIIAVLPFQNYSEDKNDWFADGFTDVMITQLAKLSDIGVIARTSTMHYKQTDLTASEVGRELGASVVLEGSILRSGGKVRITSQLIDTRTDRNLWSENYERQTEDVIALQSDVAYAIAQALKDRLTPEETRDLMALPTASAAAYDLYLQAEFYRKNERTKSDVLKAEELLSRAIEMDPDFALAHARMALTRIRLYWRENRSAEIAEQGRQSVMNALALDPDLPEAHMAMGQYYNHVHEDYTSAFDAFQRALAGLPNDTELLSDIAWLLGRQGKWDRVLGLLRQALALDPQNPSIHDELADNYATLRRYSEAEDHIKRAIALQPDNYGFYRSLGWLIRIATGDPDKERAVYAEGLKHTAPTNLYRSVGYGRIQELFPELTETLLALLRQDEELDLRRRLSAQASVLWAAGDSVRALNYFDSARVEIESVLRDNPDDFNLTAYLGLIYAKLGMVEKAVETGQLAKQIMPISTCHY